MSPRRLWVSAGAAALLAALGACQDFDKGDTVKATVGRVQGDPCLLVIQLDGTTSTYSHGLVARLESASCRTSAGSKTPMGLD